MSSAINKRGIGRYQYIVFILSGILYGCDVSAVMQGFIIEILDFQLKLTQYQKDIFPASYYIGQIFGCAISGPLTDRIGRKKPIIFGCLLILLSSLSLYAFQFFDFLIATRVMSGFASGFLLSLATTYLAEFLPGNVRGTLINIHQIWSILCEIFGCFMALLLL